MYFELSSSWHAQTVSALAFDVAMISNGIMTLPPIDATIQPVFDLYCSTALHPACQTIIAVPNAACVACLLLTCMENLKSRLKGLSHQKALKRCDIPSVLYIQFSHNISGTAYKMLNMTAAHLARHCKELLSASRVPHALQCTEITAGTKLKLTPCSIAQSLYGFCSMLTWTCSSIRSR